MAKSNIVPSLNNIGAKPTRPKIARYVFDVEVTTLSPMRIGAGVDAPLTEAESSGASPDARPFKALLIQDQRGCPFIPGATLKGVLLRHASSLNTGSQSRVAEIFGSVENNSEQSTRPGRAEFYGLSTKTDQAGIDLITRTAIDRTKRTVMDGMLLNEDATASGTNFFGQIVLHEADPDLANLLFTILGGGRELTFQLGGHTRAGWGRAMLQVSKARMFGPEQMTAWWRAPDPAGSGAGPNWVEHAEAVVLKCFRSAPQSAVKGVPLSLSFEGPFAVRDPRLDKPAGSTDIARANSRPVGAERKIATLPGTSFLGALRSQAERIVRTLGARVPPFNQRSARSPEGIPTDPVSLLFGTVGWRGLLGVQGDLVSMTGAKLVDQEMVALCRVTGSGKDHAKFKFSAWESPVLQGKLIFDTDRLAGLPADVAAMIQGLVFLTLQDLSLGDISFGMARNKGWGWTKPMSGSWLGSTITNLGISSKPAVGALTTWCENNQQATASPSLTQERQPAAHPDTSATPKAIQEIPTLRREPGKAEFHNPYHFLPFAKLHGAPMEATSGSVAQQATDAGHGHHVYQHGKLSGVLHVRLKVETPLFVGAARPSNGKSNQPVEPDPYTHLEKPAIPGSSLRGMLSQLLEPMSGSALRVLDDESLISVRMSAETGGYFKHWGEVVADGLNTDGTPILKVMEGGPSPSHGSKPLEISDMAVAMLYALADERWRAVGSKLDLSKQNKKAKIHVPPKDRMQDGKAAADMKGKVDLQPAIDWINGDPNDVRGRNPNPEILATRARLMPGQKVYFNIESKRTPTGSRELITEIAWSALYRRGLVSTYEQDPGPMNLRRFIGQREPERLPLGLRPNQGLHTAEWLMGVVGIAAKGNERDVNGLSFAGKVSVGMATSVGEIKRSPSVLLKELSSPKPPSPSLYMKTTDGKARKIRKIDLVNTAKAENYSLQGTKVYLHAQRLPDGKPVPIDEKGESSNRGKLPWESHKTPEARDSGHRPSDRQVRITPISENSEFAFEVRFDNLSRDELKLLCAALQPSKAFRHKLGMGRPIGLGSVALSITRIQLHDRVTRYRTGAPQEVKIPETPQQLAEQGMGKLREADPTLHDALLILGEPEHVRFPVHYPQIADKSIEDRNYLWWTAHDAPDSNLAEEGLFLRPLDAPIP